MPTTSITLLERLRKPGERDAWDRFVQLYTPLLLFWARRTGLPEADAADLVQEVFLVLLRKLPEFAYQPGRSFRGWLRTILVNKWRNYRDRLVNTRNEGPAALEDLAGPDSMADLVKADYQQYLVGRALQLMQVEFQPATWKACWEYVVRGRPAAEVAAELNLSVNAVYLAKSRVLTRLRQELEGLLE